ncbi:MAG: methyltransferase [Rubellimicrobium sp.]|nr:methyltransferase [Rubellimicrobium sp.]
MARNRFLAALDEGLVSIADGARVALLRVPGDWPLDGLERAHIGISHGFFPEAARWQARGFDVTRNAQPADVALVAAPRSRALARALAAEAAAAAPVVIVDGQRTDGVDALWRDARARLGAAPTLTMGHGRLFVLHPEDRLADWASAGPVRGADGFFTQPGVFSEGRADPGSRLLAGALPATLPARMGDLGAGWGYLAQAVLARAGVESLDLVEAEALALDCARHNITDDRAAFHWADALAFTPARAWGGIVMNPPFHHGRAGDPGLGHAFIAAARRGLAPNGQLWMVSNRHLPYEETLAAAFRKVIRLREEAGFVVHHATGPRR